jgi:hypothetical protein
MIATGMGTNLHWGVTLTTQRRVISSLSALSITLRRRRKSSRKNVSLNVYYLDSCVDRIWTLAFGPIAPLLKWSDEDEVVRRASRWKCFQASSVKDLRTASPR